MSPPRIVTPRLEAAITEAVRWMDAQIEMQQATQRLQAWVKGERPVNAPTTLDGLRAELLEAWDEARPKSDWIACSERLPEDDDRYLVVRRGSLPVIGYLRGPGTGRPQWVGSENGLLLSVSHWQPIPTPPR